MNETTLSLDALKSVNYSLESGLTPRNRRMLGKMFRYLHTFPLDEYEVELIRRDMIGMAQEAELRETSFAEVIGKKPFEFCDDLIFATAQLPHPRGRRFLRAAGWYYRMIGCLIFFTGFVNLVGLLLGLAADGQIWLLKVGTQPMPSIFSPIYSCLTGYLYMTAGTCAKRYASNCAKSAVCIKWGILLLLFESIAFILQILPGGWNAVTALGSQSLLLSVFFILISLAAWFFPVLYIWGGYKNHQKG